MRSLLYIFLIALVSMSFSSCYYRQQRTDAWDLNDTTLNSLAFAEHHHYTIGYNFLVRRDTLPLCTEIPSRAQQFTDVPDTVLLFRSDLIVVAQIEIVPEDSLDSIWVKVARDQETQGWVREHDLLPAVSPSDLISQAIYTFSGNHVWGTCILVAILLFVFLVRFWMSGRSKRYTWGHLRMLCFQLNMVNSPYPIALWLTMSGSAVFYSSMQLFVPHLWTEFYFHPTLNPFAVPALLGAFLFSVWAMLLFFMATVDDVIRQLPKLQVLGYLFTIVTSLAILYLFFSLTTLIYLGYPFFIVFAVLLIRYYFVNVRACYRCGNCNRPLHSKGICPYCGAKNE